MFGGVFVEFVWGLTFSCEFLAEVLGAHLVLDVWNDHRGHLQKIKKEVKKKFEGENSQKIKQK